MARHRPPVSPGKPETPFPPDRFAELCRLRLETIVVDLSSAGSPAESARRELVELGRAANHVARAIDLASNDDLVAEVCFAARGRVAEASRQLALHGDIETLRDARRLLHRSLVLLLETVSADEGVRSGQREAGVLLGAPAFADLALAVRTCVHEHPTDPAWTLDVAEVELSLCAGRAGYGSLDRALTGRLAVMHDEIVRWSASGRSEELARFLVESLVAILEHA